MQGKEYLINFLQTESRTMRGYSRNKFIKSFKSRNNFREIIAYATCMF